MSIIEHVVLFRFKDDAARSEIDSVVERVNSLVSLQEPLHLNTGPLVRIRSSPSFNFTHILHSRFKSKDDLRAYAVHPTHVAVINANAPFLADSMALDWVAEAPAAALVPPPGSALRVTFFKLKEGEGVGEQVKDDVFGAIRGIQHQQAIHFTCGENFSPARAKGFSIASLAVFPGLSELEAADSDGEHWNYDKIKEHLESVLVLDYVVSSSQAQSAS